MKLDTLDRIFSLCVRERANWTCECCGENHRHDPAYLDCSHVYGRRHRSTRWSPLNAHALCKKCHRHFTDRPLEFAAWVKTTMSDDDYRELTELHHRYSGHRRRTGKRQSSGSALSTRKSVSDGSRARTVILTSRGIGDGLGDVLIWDDGWRCCY